MTAESQTHKLRTLKQDLVRTAIRDAAIELFGSKGFDATTVEEIAQGAGVSRRSFFRYFASKDDLLSQGVSDYGAVLIATVKKCPRTMEPLEVIRRTVMAGVEHNVRFEMQTRDLFEIFTRSLSARRAHQSRLIDVETALTEAFAGRRKATGKNQLEPRLFAGVTLAVMHSALMSWFTDEAPDLHAAAEGAFQLLNLTVHGPQDPKRPKTQVPRSGSRPSENHVLKATSRA